DRSSRRVGSEWFARIVTMEQAFAGLMTRCHLESRVARRALRGRESARALRRGVSNAPNRREIDVLVSDKRVRIMLARKLADGRAPDRKGWNVGSSYGSARQRVRRGRR